MAFEFNFSVGTAAQALTGVPSVFDSVLLENNSGAASIAVTFDGSTPVVNGAGFTIAPLGSLTWRPPLNAPVTLTAVSSAAATPLSVLVD